MGISSRKQHEVVRGGTYQLEDLMTKDGRATCIDVAIAAKEICKMYGITAEMHSSLVHAYIVGK